MKELTFSLVVILWGLYFSCHGVTYSSYYAMKDHYYRNFARKDYAGWGGGLLKKIKLVQSVVHHYEYLECLHDCLKVENCNSFTIRDGYCYLNSLNRCEDNTPLLYHYEGAHTYDLFEESRVNWTYPTCFHQCLLNMNENSTCEDCGRPHCWGDSCEICPSNCWQIQGMNKTEDEPLELWLSLGQQASTVCDGNWQKVSKLARERNLLYNLDETKTKDDVALKIKVEVAGIDELFVSYFDGFDSMATDRISVGNYTGGNASNYWEAPFEDLSATYYENNTCSEFFHRDTMENCTAGSVDSFEDQFEEVQNVTLVKKAIDWVVCGHGDHRRVKKIDFYMTNMTYYNEELDSMTDPLNQC